MITEKQIVDFCANKEISHLQKGDFENLATSELRPQEIHARINKEGVHIIRQHDSQEVARIRTFMNLISSCGVDFSDVDFETIIYFGDDLTFYDDGAPRLCFTRRKNDRNILIPDPHIFNVTQLVSHFGEWDCDFKNKKDEAVFAGSYCGGSKPEENQRFKFCWDNQDNKLGNFKITNFFMNVVPNGHVKYLEEYDWNKIYGDFLAPCDQMQYKYIFNINGETNCWDRLLWAMYSNSVCMYLTPKRNDMSWYYHYFKTFGAFLKVDEIDWEPTVKWLNQNPSIAEKINKRQTKFAEPLVKTKIHYSYLKEIITRYNSIYNS
jgi:hypothetical protein